MNGETSKEDARAAAAALLSEDAEGMLSSLFSLQRVHGIPRHDCC